MKIFLGLLASRAPECPCGWGQGWGCPGAVPTLVPGHCHQHRAPSRWHSTLRAGTAQSPCWLVALETAEFNNTSPVEGILCGNKVNSFYSQFITTPLILPFEAGLGHSARKVEECCRSHSRVGIHTVGKLQQTPIYGPLGKRCLLDHCLWFQEIGYLL